MGDARKSFPLLLSSEVSMVTGQGSDRYSSYATWANPISTPTGFLTPYAGLAEATLAVQEAPVLTRVQSVSLALMRRFS